jgi:hypothetical protein
MSLQLVMMLPGPTLRSSAGARSNNKYTNSPLSVACEKKEQRSHEPRNNQLGLCISH